MNEIQFVDSVTQLHDLCQKMKQEPWLAMDTEFLREKPIIQSFVCYRLRRSIGWHVLILLRWKVN